MRRLIKDDNHLEQEVNKILGLRETRNSGALHNDGDGKGDRIAGNTYLSLLNDSKFSEKVAASVSIKKVDWYKTVSSAYRHGRIPIMTAYNRDKDGMGEIYVVLTIDDFRHIYEHAQEHIKETADE